MNTTRASSTTQHEAGKSDDNFSKDSSLHSKPRAEAMKEIVDTLHEHRTYCKEHKLDFLNYLIEIAILEATQVHMSLHTGEHQDPA